MALKENMDCRMEIAVDAQDTVLAKAIYSGSWQADENNLTLDFTAVEIAISPSFLENSFVACTLPSLVASTLSIIHTELFGVELADQDLQAVNREIQAEIDNGRVENIESLAQEFSVAYQLQGSSTLLLTGNTTVTFTRTQGMTATAPISWGEIKIQHRGGQIERGKSCVGGQGPALKACCCPSFRMNSGR